MKKKTKTAIALDAKHFGIEPDLRGNIENIDIIKAYNWYSYNHDFSQAKSWVVEYVKEFHKNEKELIKNVNRIDDWNLGTCGWNCRIILLGGNLPERIKNRNIARIRSLAMAAVESGRGRDADEIPEEEGIIKKEEAKKIISIQERIVNRTNDLISDIECHLDNYYRDETQFKAVDWLSQNDVKPQIAQRIADYYKPLYSEAFDALNGKDEQLKEGYSHWKKSKLKAYVEFIKSIVSAAETRAVVVKTIRKPRKKKEKPASVLVAKLKYKEKDDEYKVVSVDPKQIIGSNQLWVFNTKYRTMTVYNAMGPVGLGVKGSTITGFDEKTSIVKKLRKPNEQVNKLMDGGKIVLRKYMDEIKCKAKEATGRINTDMILLRTVK